MDHTDTKILNSDPFQILSSILDSCLFLSQSILCRYYRVPFEWISSFLVVLKGTSVDCEFYFGVRISLYWQWFYKNKHFMFISCVIFFSPKGLISKLIMKMFRKENRVYTVVSDYYYAVCISSPELSAHWLVYRIDWPPSPPRSSSDVHCL